MNRFESVTKPVIWFMALLLAALAAGCGGGGGRDAILGTATLGLAPAVTIVSPLPNATAVPINTKIITAAFTKAMDPATLTPASFTLACPAGTPVTGVVTYLAAGNVATLTLPATPNLPAGTVCTATITTAAKDATGIALAGNFVWTFTTGAAPDTTAPTVTGTINANGATNVAINTKVGATFSEAMDPSTITTTTFTLKQGATIVPGTVAYLGVNAVFTPASNLAASTPYTVTVTTGAKDVAGNPMAANFTIGWTTAAAPDTTAPTVTGTIQTNGQTGVAINTSAGATFSEGMDPLTITNLNFTLTTDAGAAVPGVVSYSGVSAVFRPLSNLASSTHYNVTVKGGVGGVTDLAGNPMAANFTIGWTTAAAPDTTAPTVTGTINANGATNVAINTSVGATFSEGMDPLTITNLNFTLTTDAGAAVPGAVSYSGVNAVFRPLSNLASSTHYNVTVKGGIGGVTDLAGNPMASDFVIGWTTAAAPDTTAPTVILVNPADLATGVATSTAVNATFSEAMDPLTISTATFSVAGVTGTVAYDAASKIATFTPASNLAASTTYTATVTTGVMDLAGNPLALNKVWSFTTAAIPVIPPTVALGSVSTYGTFGGTAGMTNQGILTIINGNIGTIATTTSTVTGFHDTEGDIFTETGSNIGNVNGTIYTCTNSVTGPNSTGVNAAYCALATQARLDAQTAYLALAAMPSDGVLAGNLAGTTINPGVYTNSSSVLIQGGDLTLDALGDANAIFVFQIGSTLTVGGPGAAFPQSIILAGGAQAKNVFWQVGTAATINAGGGGTMVGTIISQAGVSFSTAGNVALVTLNGRALSLGASVTMVNTVINVPAP